MDAKADGAEATGADEAIVTDTDSGSAALRSIEERLEAGLNQARADGAPPEDDATPPSEDEVPADETTIEEEDGKFKEGELEGLGAKAQAKVNARIHELNVKRKNAEAEASALKEKLAPLEEKLADAYVQAVMKTGLDPEYVTPEEAKLLTRAENLRAWKRWLRQHRDGYDGSGAKDDPSMSAEQVAAREAEIEDELLDVAGPARTLWMERTKQMRADMAAGRQLRLNKVLKPGSTPQLPKPPKLPATAGAGARRPLVGAGRREKAVFSSDEFNQAGADENALEKQYEKIFGGG